MGTTGGGRLPLLRTIGHAASRRMHWNSNHHPSRGRSRGPVEPIDPHDQGPQILVGNRYHRHLNPRSGCWLALKKTIAQGGRRGRHFLSFFYSFRGTSIKLAMPAACPYPLNKAVGTLKDYFCLGYNLGEEGARASLLPSHLGLISHSWLGYNNLTYTHIHS